MNINELKNVDRDSLFAAISNIQEEREALRERSKEMVALLFFDFFKSRPQDSVVIYPISSGIAVSVYDSSKKVRVMMSTEQAKILNPLVNACNQVTDDNETTGLYLSGEEQSVYSLNNLELFCHRFGVDYEKLNNLYENKKLKNMGFDSERLGRRSL